MEKYQVALNRIIEKVECITEDSNSIWIKSIYKKTISITEYKKDDYKIKFFNTLEDAKKYIIKNYNSEILVLKEQIKICQNKINQIEKIRKI